MEEKPIEIILGNKNVAEAGSQQINISQNIFNAETLKEVLEKVQEFNGSSGANSSSGSSGSSGSKEEVPQPSSINPQPSHKPKKPKAARIVEDTFTYRWLNDSEGRLRLVTLYQKLSTQPLGWLDASVTPEQWCALFMGKPQSFTMKWLGTQMQLKHLFKLMIDGEYITFAPGVGHWEIVGSHFLNDKSKPFTTDWNRVSTPKRGVRVIENLAKILNIGISLNSLKSHNRDFDLTDDE